MKLIIDTNLIFSALLKTDSPEFHLIRSRQFEIYILQYTTVELFKYKEKILKYTRLSEIDVYTSYYSILQRLRVLGEDEISDQQWKDARKLCLDVDPKDSPYIAAALSLNAFIWTGDKKLRTGLEAKGFYQFRSTAELLKLLPEGQA